MTRPGSGWDVCSRLCGLALELALELARILVVCFLAVGDKEGDVLASASASLSAPGSCAMHQNDGP